MHAEQLTQIGIIGAGELGQSLGQALTRAKMQVLYYDVDAAKTTTAGMEDLVRACQILFICVPSWAVEAVNKDIRNHSRPSEDRLVICCSKGVLPGFETMDKVMDRGLPKHYHYGLLYGPMTAIEIVRSKLADGVMALSETSYFAPLRQIFAQGNIMVELSGDMRGIAICAVLKNVYSIGLGICDGLRLGTNAKSRLVVLMMREIKHLVAELGGNPLTADSSAGLGDLLSAGFSNESFNYRIGKSLAEGIVDSHVKSEGVVALHELSRKIRIANFPIASFLNQAAFHYAKPQSLIELLK